MKPTLIIFSHKNTVASLADMLGGNFRNDPNDLNQLGILVDVSNVEITPAALALLKADVTKSSDSFSSVMLTKADNGSMSIGLLGCCGKHILKDNNTAFQIGRDCTVEVLDSIKVNEDIEIPANFIEFVEEFS